MKPTHTLFAALARCVVVFLLGMTIAKAAPTHELVASFHRPPQNPGYGGLVLGPDGYYWGATAYGGAYGYGAIYKVRSDGSDLLTVLSFTGNGATNKGATPYAGLVRDSAGYLWGTTKEGGASGYGTVFKVNASTATLTTLVEFTDYSAPNKGRNPYAGLVSDGAGFFWGTTSGGREQR